MATTSQDGQNVSRAHPPEKTQPEAVFPACRNSVDSPTWKRILALFEENLDPETFPRILERQRDQMGLPAYLPELALLELTLHLTLMDYWQDWVRLCWVVSETRLPSLPRITQFCG